MTVKELDQRLETVVDHFTEEMRNTYDDYSSAPATGSDIAQVARQTFYALNAFRQEIVKYLEANR